MGKAGDDDAMSEPITIDEPVVYQLRVVLRSVSPLIWRRLLVLAAGCPRGDSAPATDTAWVDTARFNEQDLLDAHVMLPAVGEIVFIEEALMAAEFEIGQVHTARVDETFGAVLTSVNHETMEMLVAPAEGDL